MSSAASRKTLAIYLMSGPDTPELADAAVDCRRGHRRARLSRSPIRSPTVQWSGERPRQALAQGMRTQACLECLAAVRARVDVPLVPMTYSSLLEAYGWERFAESARAAGATSLIVADLPAGERQELKRVQLVAPTSTDERLRLAAELTDGWLYLVTLTGTTGARSGVSAALGRTGRARARRRRAAFRSMPASASRHPADARAAAELTDGVVVGSRALEEAENGPAALGSYVRSLRDALDQV